MTDFVLSMEKAGDLPYLQLAPVDSSPTTSLVFVLHGLGSHKEKIFPTVFAFAQKGYRVVAPDARLHGERLQAHTREQRMSDAYIETLYEIISGTAKDLSTLLNDLGADRAAIHGISLGGFVAFAALLTEPRLAVASVAMGSPDWLEPLRVIGVDLTKPPFTILAEANPLDNAAAAYPPRPLLMLHGTEDEVVSVKGVEALDLRLRSVYAAMPERLKLVLYPGLGHQYTDDMLQKSIAWTQRFL